MAAKMLALRCPECNANISIEEDRNIVFCSYCGTKILISNDNEKIIKKIDVAEIKRAENVAKQIEIDEKIEKTKLEQQNNKNKIKRNLILGYLGLIILLIFSAFICHFFDKHITNNLIVIIVGLVTLPIVTYISYIILKYGKAEMHEYEEKKLWGLVKKVQKDEIGPERKVLLLWIVYILVFILFATILVFDSNENGIIKDSIQEENIVELGEIADEETNIENDKIDVKERRDRDSDNYEINVGLYTFSIPNYFEKKEETENTYRAYAENGEGVTYIHIVSRYDDMDPVSYEILEDETERGLMSDAVTKKFQEHSDVIINDFEQKDDVRGYIYSLDGKIDGKECYYYNLTYPSVANNSWINVILVQSKKSEYDYTGDFYEIIESIMFNEEINEKFQLNMPDLYNMTLDKAITQLQNYGFSDIEYEPQNEIWVRGNWVVNNQNFAPGENVYKCFKIHLDCVKVSDYLSNNYLLLNINEATKKAEEFNNEILFFDYLNGKAMASMISNMQDSAKKNWIVKRASIEEEKIKLELIYIGKIKMPDVCGKSLDVALRDLKNLGCSAVEYVVDGNSSDFVFLEENWKVTKQDILAGTEYNANNKIILSVIKKTDVEKNIANNKVDDEVKEQPKKVDYSTNDYEDAKNGNSGVFAYKSKGGVYENYYIIDFDEGYVYSFSEGNGNDIGDKVKIQSGDLNDLVLITFNDGVDKWSYGLHFKWKRQPDHLIVEDNDHFEYDFYSTNLNKAKEIMSKKKFSKH